MEFENIISAADKARILAEALPYIRRFSGSSPSSSMAATR